MRRIAENTIIPWLGMIFPPTIWLIQMQVSYLLVLFACSTGQVLPLHLVSAIFFLICVGSGLVFWRNSKKEYDSGTPKFLSSLGILNSVIFSLLIVAQEIPRLILNPCQF